MAGATEVKVHYVRLLADGSEFAPSVAKILKDLDARRIGHAVGEDIAKSIKDGIEGKPLGEPIEDELDGAKDKAKKSGKSAGKSYSDAFKSGLGKLGKIAAVSLAAGFAGAGMSDCLRTPC